nr:MAG TPA: hypothetical protein [Caudoviricetes sp.]
MNKRRYKEYKVVINTNPNNPVLNYEYDPNKNIHITNVADGTFYKGLYRLVNNGTTNTNTAYPRSLNDVFSKYKKTLEEDTLHVYRLYNNVDENAILNVIKNGNGHIYLKRMPSGRYYDDAVIDRIELLLTNTENDVKNK